MIMAAAALKISNNNGNSMASAASNNIASRQLNARHSYGAASSNARNGGS